MTQERENAVEAAKAVLLDLQTRRRDVLQRKAWIERDRAVLAYAGLAGGDAEAADRLSNLGAQAAALEQDLLNLDAALVSAEEKVTAAQEAAAAEIHRANAREILGMLEEFTKIGATAQEHIEAFIGAYSDLSAIAAKIIRKGGRLPSGSVAGRLMTRAIDTHLERAGLNREPLRQGDRRTISGAVAELSRHAETAAREALGNADNRAAAE